jgi:hypothetical protein
MRLLRQLPCGFTIQRCCFCIELAFADEVCAGEDEALGCPSRAEFDESPDGPSQATDVLPDQA